MVFSHLLFHSSVSGFQYMNCLFIIILCVVMVESIEAESCVTWIKTTEM